MTKKDYELVALALKQAGHYHKIDISKLASDMAYILAGQNPRFDRDKFLQACGIETAFEQQEREDSEEFHHYANLEQ